jgi:hypothetical protein
VTRAFDPVALACRNACPQQEGHPGSPRRGASAVGLGVLGRVVKGDRHIRVLDLNMREMNNVSPDEKRGAAVANEMARMPRRQR